MMFASGYFSHNAPEKLQRDIKENRGWYAFEGLLFIALGVFAFAMPMITAFAFEFVLAAFLLVGGIMRIIYGSTGENKSGARVASGAVFAIAGALVFAWPVTGMAALLAVVGALLIIEGIFDIGLAMSMRSTRRWGWMLTAGIISLLLGIFVFSGFPATGIIYLAVALGVSFLFYGIAVMAMAMGAEE